MDHLRQLKTRRETRTLQRQSEQTALANSWKAVRDVVLRHFSTAKENEQARVRKARQEDEDRDRYDLCLMRVC